MSEASSRGSAASTSASNEPATSSGGSASSTSGAGACSPSTGREFRAYMPFRTLQPDGTVEEGFAERPVVDALHGPTGNKEPLIAWSGEESNGIGYEDESPTLRAPSNGAHVPILFTSSAEASPAKTSVSPDDAPDSPEPGAASSTSSPESLTLFSPLADGSSLRTFPDFFPASAAEISPSFSRRWPTSGFTTSRGECWTADTSESPNAGAVSTSLRDVLEASVPARYFLSPRAAAGILRRAEKRGRELPSHLSAALVAVAQTITTAKQDAS